MRCKLPAGLRAPLFALTAFALAAPVPASAQYFGRNKVQYETFDFEVLKTEHFDIYYYEDEAESVEQAARMAERWYSRLSRLLDHELRGRQPLILYASHPHFEQTNAIFGDIGEGTGGVTEALKRRIVLPMAGPLAETDHVLGHELVHAFQYDITSQGGGQIGFRAPTALALPLWFIEGMAEYLSLGPVDPHTAMWMRDAAARSDEDCCELPTIRQLNNPKYFPYRYGHALWAYVAGEYGDEAVGKILKVAGRSANALGALETVLQIPTDSLSEEWHAALREQFGQVAARTVPADSMATEILSEERTGGGLNVGPALSPDGSRVVFLSEKDLFSIEMFLADAETGEIIRRLTKTRADPHYESLQFINSAGAWSPDGSVFVYAGIKKGQPVLTFVDARDGDRVQEIRMPALGEVFNPSFSPDGRQVAFSAITGGATDLFIADRGTGEYRRLTNDLYGDLQPAWSPDGGSIAFVTDRFTTNLETLEYGNYRLATIDPGSGEIQPLPVFGRGKHINPAWSADGASLFFVTDVSGISQVYRYEFADGRLFEVTRIPTGVSGITPLSPVISTAARAERLVFTAYEEGDYNLYRLDGAQLAGEPIEGRIADASPAVLPPPDRAEGLVSVLLEEPELGLADTLTFDRTDYSPSLRLDYVSQPQVAAGADRFGAFIGGGVSLFFSDMLGNRTLGALVNVNTAYGSVDRSSVLVLGYENRRTRWNWGVQAGQIPFFNRAFRTFQSGGLIIQDELRQWQINRQVSGGLSYPFNRAQRVEFSAGFQNIDFEQEVRTRTFDAATLELLDEETTDLDAPAAINMATSSAALVFDNTLFGGTGPISGQRYRLEVSPRVGDLTYYNALADYRRYLMVARPVSLAGRLVHFGRYGGDAEDNRLSDLFLGFPSLVRGYDDGSFDVDECQGTPEDPNSCPVFEQLFGSRIAVANAELRVPLLGFLGLIPSPAAPPVETAVFFDAGVAWTKADEASFLGGDRDIVSSYGVAMRVNLLGFVVAEVDYVHPNDRPQKGWIWQFSLAPAF